MTSCNVFSPFYGEKWVVAGSRGQIFGTMSEDTSGEFTMTYEGIFKLKTQAGILKGLLRIENIFLKKVDFPFGVSLFSVANNDN